MFGDDSGTNEGSQVRLRKRMAKNLQANMVEVLLCVDDSGSISDPDFVKLRQAGEEILRISASNNGARFAGVMFHSTSTIVSPWRQSAIEVQQALNSHVRKRGGTNTSQGLTDAQQLYSRGRNNAKRLLFLLTDGEANDKADAERLAAQLKFTQGAMVFVLAVGKHFDMDHLAKVASYGCLYRVDNYEALLEALKDNERNDSSVQHDLHVTLRAYTVNSPVKFSQDLKYQLEVHNVGTVALPAGTRIWLSEQGHYFNETCVNLPHSLEVGDKTQLSFTLNSQKRHFRHLSDGVQFSIKHPHGAQVYCDMNEIEFRSQDFIGNFIGYRPPSPATCLNILMFGVIGSGKSSFTNTILSAFSDQVMDNAQVGGDGDHCTTDYRRFHLGQLCGLTGTEIALWDSWGLDEETYGNDFLMTLLRGDLPSGYEMVNVSIVDGAKRDPDNMHQVDRRIHGVLMFVPINILEDSVMLLRIKDALRLTNKMKLNAQVVVTRADTVSGKQNRVTLQERIAKELNLAPLRVNLVKNYIKVRDKDFGIDKVALRVFADIVDTAHQYVKTYVAASPSSPTCSPVDSPQRHFHVEKPNDPGSPYVPRQAAPQPSSHQSTSASTPPPSSGADTLLVHHGQKVMKVKYNDSTTFYSLLKTVCFQYRLPHDLYALADAPVEGCAYGVEDKVCTFTGLSDLYLVQF